MMVLNNREAAGNSRYTAETAAAVLVILSFVVSVLYPETFIKEGPTILAHKVTPLALLMPVMAIGAVAMLYVKRNRLAPGLIEYMFFLFIGFKIGRAHV